MVALLLTVAAAYDFAALDRYLESAPLKGFSLTISRDGEILYQRAFGDYEVNRTVHIASATKWYSAAVIAALADRGKLSLDGRLSKYLPEFRAEKARITFRQAFSHTSGLPGNTLCVLSPRSTLAACAPRIARLRLDNPPGEAFAYGNASMQAAGRAAEVAGGKPWVALFDELIGRPLRFTCTSYNRPSNPVLAGGAKSCTEDYLRFLTMIAGGGVFEGRRVLSAKVIADMRQDQRAGRVTRFSPEGIDGAGYGLGQWIEGEGREISSPGAFGFSPWIDWERGVAGVLSAESNLRDVLPVWREAKRIVREIVPLQ